MGEVCSKKTYLGLRKAVLIIHIAGLATQVPARIDIIVSPVKEGLTNFLTISGYFMPPSKSEKY